MQFLVPYILLEILISLSIFSSLGVFGSFIEIIFSAFIGFLILANFRLLIISSLKAINQRDKNPQALLKQSTLSIMGAFCLILPGIISDIIGIILQFGFLNSFVKSFLYKDKQEKDYIDVEVIERK